MSINSLVIIINIINGFVMSNITFLMINIYIYIIKGKHLNGLTHSSLFPLGSKK